MTYQEISDLIAGVAIAQDRAEIVAEKRNADFAAQIAEMRKTQAESSAKFDKQIAKMNTAAEKRKVEFDKQFAEMNTAAEKRGAELDKRIDKLSIKIDKIGDHITNLSNMYGGVSEHLGDEAELDFCSALTESPELSKVKFDKVVPNLTRKDKKTGDHVEIDVFLLNTNSMAIVEVKRHLQSKHIDELHNKTIPKFLALYPEYKNKKLYAALATYSIPKKSKPFVDNRLNKYGYALITPNRNGVSVDVDAHCMRVLN